MSGQALAWPPLSTITSVIPLVIIDIISSYQNWMFLIMNNAKNAIASNSYSSFQMKMDNCRSLVCPDLHGRVHKKKYIWHMCLLSLLKEAIKTHFSRARKKLMSTVQVAATFSAPDWIKIGTKAPESLSQIFWASLIHPFHPYLRSFHRKRPCNFLEVEILRTKKMQRILELWGQGWVKVSAWVEGALPKN